MKLIFVSGRSGSGKSSALHALEDCGYYCIDNLPEPLLLNLLDTISSSPDYEKTAISVDIRNFDGSPGRLGSTLEVLNQKNIQHQIIFLDSDEDTIVKRYNASRRKHPLSSDQRSLRDAIKLERNILAPLLNNADLVVDTSTMSVHDLRSLMRNRIATHKQSEVSLLIQSFGFKYGVPTDSDLMFDVRCLPNPYWEPALRNFTGRDAEIAEFLNSHDTTHQMLDDIKSFIERWTPHYQKSGRAYITVSIGCTGGCHRSVYIAEQLSQYFSNQYSEVHLKHTQL
jgi:UPF0042 nucleotide-binding protein